MKCEYFEQHSGAVGIVWEVEYSYSRYVPATYLDPPEGGLELESVRPIALTLDGPHEQWEVAPIQDGSMLAIILESHYTPSDKGMLRTATEDYYDRDADDYGRDD